MYEDYTRQALPLKGYRELLGSAKHLWCLSFDTLR